MGQPCCRYCGLPRVQLKVKKQSILLEDGDKYICAICAMEDRAQLYEVNENLKKDVAALRAELSDLRKSGAQRITDDELMDEFENYTDDEHAPCGCGKQDCDCG